MYTDQLSAIFDDAQSHREEHRCGGYPYQHGDVLTALVAATNSQNILELGTGLGYTAACLALGNSASTIHTIDQDQSHLDTAQNNWKSLNLQERIKVYHGKAEAILPELTDEFDMVFFDGYAPSLKFLIHFERLLKKRGLLVTANLFVKDPLGGRYVRALKDNKKWQSGFFADTAVSVKLF